MLNLLDLPMELFCAHIFPHLSTDDLIWNVGFVSDTLQLYVIHFLNSIVINYNIEEDKISSHPSLRCLELLSSRHIANAISHIVNKNCNDYELVEEIKLEIESNRILLEIQNNGYASSSSVNLLDICTKCQQAETFISIGTNILPTKISAAASCLENLKALILSCKDKLFSLTDAELIAISSNCPKLEVIVLMDHVELTDSGIISISANCTKLRNLNIKGCDKITDMAIHKVTKNCEELRSLDLYGCDKITDESLKSISIRSKNIEEIDIGQCLGVTDEGIKLLALNCKGLKAFDASSCYKLSDESLRHLSINCSNLEFLALEFCTKLTNRCVQYIESYCKNLQHLDLHGCDGITKDWKRLYL